MRKLKYYLKEFLIWCFYTYEIPEEWNKLTDFQLKLIGHLFYTENSIKTKYFKELVFAALVMRKPSLKYVFKVIFIFFKTPSSDLIRYTDFVFNENESLTRFIPVIKVGSIFSRKKLLGPGIRLSNISIQELSYADAFFYNWIKEPSSINLQRLVACLYRPISKTPKSDDKREEFNKLLLPDNAIHTDKIPLHVQYIIALAYQGSREKIMDKFTYVFPKSKTEETEAAPKKQKQYQPFSKIINAMAMDDNKIFGTLTETEKANAFQFLEIYNETIRQSIIKK